ncbi:MAG: acyl-CoA ligase (AMP-forming), exosortase A system-associated [Herminiimonas sp.]|nr:acyl-CoA ligase (AMP-forming), exosortase A system-associated [Herminiimonas sp.]
MNELIHQCILDHARRTPDAPALSHGAMSLSYAELASQVGAMAALLVKQGLGRGQRVAVFLEKRIENVVAMFGAAAAGAVFVPINPLLRADQVAYILTDCNVTMLVTSTARLASLDTVVGECADLQTVFVIESALPAVPCRWDVRSLPAALAAAGTGRPHRIVDIDMAAILYTSGSTGKPKGVVLSHRNLVSGAASVCSYLGNGAHDRILAVLPLSFDYGLSQLTTAFYSGASAVLLNYLGPRDIIDCVRTERITGLAAVPPLWAQLARHAWPADSSLRYLTNSGGALPRATLDLLRTTLPRAELFLMYGLTEAFRSTYLPPDEIARRPDSIGRAIPNAEVLVLRPDGTPCGIDEEGELVHRGAQVALGYWNDPLKTAMRFRPLPVQGLPLAEIAVWSGDTVRMDADGFLYFIGRRDDMMKVSGYRVSPTEIEEVLASCPEVAEVVVFGLPHAESGDAIAAIVVPNKDATVSIEVLQAHCRKCLPLYMMPTTIVLQATALPRNPNGKFDRRGLRELLLAQSLEQHETH